MTDRIHSFTVVLDRDVRADDVQVLANAILCLKFVVDVVPQVAGADFYVAREQAKRELRTALVEVLAPRARNPKEEP